ncbi:uncharacterized protein J8A68_001189 [[Candida] subhashii]|uniref:Survival protein SurE-like phosphatase/nucleotidase domain-containing protein n=1 Tax=[Candida] subhashii TaxID=561895 RepID=A0A8J5UK50_9ASCO|nr:uncharacterized protein J8A68_001189 [[Candida] subhashii]KAG7665133.1 hypothetical protein J8A68_001189 [[Candida] subhashii]
MRSSLILLTTTFISQVLTLNIVLTTTDNWVAKNIRMLYSHLKHHNHNVILVAPLYQTIEDDDAITDDPSAIEDGGEYGHLLPVHQTYFKNIKLLNSRKAKHVIPRQDIFIPVKTSQFGQDPLEKDAWYINSSPMDSLTIGMDILLPKYYPDFKPDLIIVGPNEGLESLATVGNMIESSIDNYGIPVIGISTQDSHAVYYHDEKYFQINPSNTQHLLKHNIFGKNIKFINKQVDSLIDNITQMKKTNNSAAIGLNVMIPSINHAESHCMTSKHSQLEYQQVVLPNFNKIPTKKFEIDDTLHISTVSKNISKRDTKQEDGPTVVVEENDVEHKSTFVDVSSYYYQFIVSLPEEKHFEEGPGHYLRRKQTIVEQVLGSCHIAVSIVQKESTEIKGDVVDLNDVLKFD